ncbi:Spy/CpxP family protein refolding chaperone [Burkholderia alba]|uniref:Spy/CpxP family protein refolding chaperone n=1 Tax=Burkholderia alba TaxID=2683677 RepID=UPI002B059EBA|nr:Spy/CpxP family protein refolding chaperone [Burkholderia alba]
MKKLSLTIAAALALSSALVHAQTPAAAPAAEPAAASQGAARHEARIEERITYLHNQLKITPEQEPQWKTFADTMRDNGAAMGRLYRARMENKNVSALDDMKQYAELSQTNADGAKKLADTFAPLYDAFPPEQKAIADATFRKWLQGGPTKARAHKKAGKADSKAAAPAADAASAPAAQ